MNYSNQGFGGGFGGSSGGGGFDTFNGGGFPTSSASSPQQQRSFSDEQTLTPVTFKLLKSANEKNGVQLLDGVGLKWVSVIAKVVRKESSSTAFTLMLDDGTATGEAVAYVTEQGGDKTRIMREWLDEVKDSMYVEVVARVTPNFKLSIESVRPVKDFNKITYHHLKVLDVHLQRTRGKDYHTQKVGASSSSSNIGSVKMDNEQKVEESSVKSDDSHLSDRILAVMRSENLGEEGVSVSHISKVLGNVSEQKVREVALKLCDDGAVYVGIDDDHYICTD